MEGGCACDAVRYRLDTEPLFIHCCHCLSCRRQAGTAVFSEYTYPDIWFVRGGTLDELRNVEPDVHIFTRSKVPWIALPEGVPAVEAFYDLEELWPRESRQRIGR